MKANGRFRPTMPRQLLATKVGSIRLRFPQYSYPKEIYYAGDLSALRSSAR
jgi:hypothetical protein